ncbi:MAG TPA: hypothetical protein VGZ48_07335 [Candidatus Acidoferrales bacterium]|jgi:hypothetical protein|nr:hypothetical protein [Candidatus Acidoferrales bacterium]
MIGRYKFDEDQHLHSLDGKPLIGTSTVVGVVAKPLTWWASGLAVSELGWIKALKLNDKPKPTTEQIEANKITRLEHAIAAQEKIGLMEPEEYLALLDSAYRAHADTLTKSADKGTDMHAELEEYVKFTLTEHRGEPILLWDGYKHKAVEIFADWAVKNVKRFLVSEGHCYSEKLWTGGIVDLVFEDKQDRLAIMDFKSSKEAYLSQFFQIGGYDLEISENGIFDADGILKLKVDKEISYYAVFPFGMEDPAPQFHYDTVGAMQGFEAATVLYKLINNN